MAELLLPHEALYHLMAGFFTTGVTCCMKIRCPGSSMSPFIRHNSALTLAPFPPGRPPGFGDIVITAVHAKKKILIHRVIAASPPRYLIKGDRNKVPDGWFHRKDILGFVKKVEGQTPCYTPASWQNLIIGTASRTGVLNNLLLPAAKCLRQLKQ